MPKPKDPLLPEFYVYAFEADGIVFYIGLGRSTRASDRVRYVKYLMRREQEGKPVKWVRSNRVIAEHLRRGKEVQLRYLHQGLIRQRAEELELHEIRRLQALGVKLANIIHN